MDPVPVITNLGIAGFAIWVMYKMYQSSSARFKEKDMELIQEIDKRDKRNERSEDSFRTFANEVHLQTTNQINENTKVLQEVIQVLREKKRVEHK